MSSFLQILPGKRIQRVKEIEAFISKTNLVYSVTTCISLLWTNCISAVEKKTFGREIPLTHLLSWNSFHINSYSPNINPVQINELLFCAHRFRKTASVILGGFSADTQGLRRQQRDWYELWQSVLLLWKATSDNRGMNCDYSLEKDPRCENQNIDHYSHLFPPMFLVKA